MADTLSELLADAIERINTGDDFTWMYAELADMPYRPDESVVKDLRRLQQVFIDNPHFDDMLYLAAFTRQGEPDDEVYTRARFGGISGDSR